VSRLYRDSFAFYHVNRPNLVTCWFGLNGTINAASVAHNRCLVAAPNIWYFPRFKAAFLPSEAKIFRFEIQQ
jgi:hypothetical protein